MSHILSVGTWNPPYYIEQDDVMTFARDMFHDDFDNIDHLLKVFHTGQIDRRYFSAPLDWFKEQHSFEEKNNLYKEIAVRGGVEAIKRCLTNRDYVQEEIDVQDVEALIFVSSTGLSTPSLDATIMNQLPFNSHTKRIPLWGLGCGGGTAGLARADEFCRAFPEAAAIVLSVELCSLTFQHGDKSKSNFVGASLFADGAACVLVVGDRSPLLKRGGKRPVPKMLGAESTLMPHSEDVMGWEIRNEGLFVVFAKSIPTVVSTWFKPTALDFLKSYGMTPMELDCFIAHPGGRKVLEAYDTALQLGGHMLDDSRDVLKEYGNMSSPTVLYVLDRAMKKATVGDKGLTVSLGPGFTAELLMLEWVVGG